MRPSLLVALVVLGGCVSNNLVAVSAPASSTSLFAPHVTAVLAPPPSTTTTLPVPSTPGASAMSVPSTIRVDVAQVESSDVEPVIEHPPDLGYLSTPSTGTQPIAASLDDGVRIQVRAGCGLLLSGHRTDGPAPFRHLDKLVPGDEVLVVLNDATICRPAIARIDLITEAEAFRRVNLFEGNNGDGAMYACADSTGAPGGLSHRWWVTLVTG